MPPKDRTRSPEPVTIGSYPRDDVPVPLDGAPAGLAYVFTTQNPATPVATLHLGNLTTTTLPTDEYPIGSFFTVRLEATFEAQAYEQVLTFEVTGQERDVDHYTVGPGASTERGRWGRTIHHGFEFGVLVMGAVPQSP